eukprot:9106858-Pyramimonas_sp.AAC.1
MVVRAPLALAKGFTKGRSGGSRTCAGRDARTAQQAASPPGTSRNAQWRPVRGALCTGGMAHHVAENDGPSSVDSTLC